MTALQHTQEKSKAAAPVRPEESRRGPLRERTSGQAEATAGSKSRTQPAGQDASLFGDLLLNQTGTLPPPVHMQWAGVASPEPMATRAPENAQPASPVRIWQQIEPALSGVMETRPTGPVSMTLLLPKLGEVDARLSPLAAGWDISLRFAPPALALIAPHQERCRESLRRRMACPVRLRFEQRGDRG